MKMVLLVFLQVALANAALNESAFVDGGCESCLKEMDALRDRVGILEHAIEKVLREKAQPLEHTVDGHQRHSRLLLPGNCFVSFLTTCWRFNQVCVSL